MPIDPQRMAAILQRVQLARQAGAGGGMPPIGEYNGGGDIVTPQPPMQMQQMPQQMSMSTPISQLPVTQQLPNYDNMHQSDNNPLVGATTPGFDQMSQGPMPASEFMGFSTMGGGYANF